MKDSARECEKPEDGTVATFLGFPQRKNPRMIGDDYRPLPRGLMIDPWSFPPGALRMLMFVVAFAQRLIVWSLYFVTAIGVLVGSVWFLRAIFGISEWMLKGV